MNKKILTSCILFSCSLFSYFTKSDAHTKVHDNYLYFTHDAHSVSFTAESHCITRGQPYRTTDGRQAQNTSNGVGIDIKAGRHGSSGVIDCILSMFDKKNITRPFSNKFTLGNYPRNGPGELNFATEGKLTIDGKTFDKVILAQGHHGSNNYWWFGGINCTNPLGERTDKVSCTSTDGTKWCFTHGRIGGNISTGPNHVKVQEHSCDT